MTILPLHGKISSPPPKHVLWLVVDAGGVQVSDVIVTEFGDFKFGGVGFEITLYDDCVLLLAL